MGGSMTMIFGLYNSYGHRLNSTTKEKISQPTSELNFKALLKRPSPAHIFVGCNS